MPFSDEVFTQALWQVPGAYDDFVIGLADCATDHEVREHILQYIQEHPEANSSEISKYYFDNYWNEEDDYDEDTVFYDENE